jgi:GT2 family glycosyltransferase
MGMPTSLPNPLAPVVSIVVVNWNGAQVLPRCLEALSAQTYRDFEVIVVDNGSTDGSTDDLEAHWSGVRVLRLGENKGFAVANNLGAVEARGRWLVLVNNDAFPETKWLEILIEATQQYPEYTFFGSRLVQYHNPEMMDGAGDVYHISGLAWRRYYNHPVSEIKHQVEEIFGPCAAAAMYLRKNFLKVGGFAEYYFSYHEDVDLSFRLRLAGYRCLYIPDAVVKHIGSATTGVQSDFAVYYGHRNLVWSFFQNMPTRLLWKYLLAHIVANLIYLVYYSSRGQARAIWRAKWDAFRDLPAALRRRRGIQESCAVGPVEIDRVVEHGWLGPYILGFRSRQKARQARRERS